MEAMEEEPNDVLDTIDETYVARSVKRLASPVPGSSKDYPDAKRIRSTSPQGDLEIDLDGAPDETPEEEPPPVPSVSRWANVFPVRTNNGRLVLVPYRNRQAFDTSTGTSASEGERLSLLQKPFWDLFLEAEAELERLRQVPVSHLDTSGDNAALPEGYADVEETRPGGRKDNKETKRNDQLWTDKYKPKGFRDLLSDAALNRILLQWIKLWDACVFNKEVKKPPPIPQETDDKKKFFQRDQLPELNLELDKSRRPLQPVVLLAGPPGLGKTTLAHVLARHSGYNVVELNASDDRSPDAFRSALESATQMTSVLDKDSRPNCLVIDEIDGAPSQSIAVLLNLLKPAPVENKNKKGKPKVLLRPVICICNDPWGSALRQLRQNSILIQMPPTQNQRLSARLQEVLRKERMKFDPAAVQTLADKTGNDIRSCLSTLQFLHSKKGAVTMTDVTASNIGNKDAQQTLGNVLNGIFTKPRETQTSGRRPRSQDIPNLAQSFGDYERLNQALFDTYINRQGLDSEMTSKVPLSTEWLCFADQMQFVMQSTQNYSLMAYGPYLAARFHTIHAMYRPTKLAMNNSHVENYQKSQKMKHHLSSLSSSTSPLMAAQYSGSNILLEVLPFVFGIIQPQLRSSNVQLLNEEDRVKFRSATDVMSAFGLMFQQRHIEGRYSFELEPNIEELVRFPGIEQSFVSLTYAAKLMFSRTLELKKVRSSDAPATSSAKPKKVTRSLPHTSKPVRQAEKVRKDFFGRVVKTKTEEHGSASQLTTNSSESRSELCGVYYKFKEGFSNAVRKNLKIKQIL